VCASAGADGCECVCGLCDGLSVGVGVGVGMGVGLSATCLYRAATCCNTPLTKAHDVARAMWSDTFTIQHLNPKP